MKPRKWKIEDLIIATAESTSIRQVIIKLGLVPAGGNYDHVNRYIKELELDTSHFLGKGWSKGKLVTTRPAKPLYEVLVKPSVYKSHTLKIRLWRECLLPEYCEICQWSERTKDDRLPLELDHINGDRYDNRLENLRILCPNCHSLQPTHRERNIKKQ